MNGAKSLELINGHDAYYFAKAREVVKKSTSSKCSVGCVIVLGGAIIATGTNSDKTHPVQQKYNKFRTLWDDGRYFAKIHAEISALVKLKDRINRKEVDMSKADIYVCRIKHDGTHGMSRPCPACMAYIRDCGVRNIYYTTDDGCAYERISDGTPDFWDVSFCEMR